MLTGSFDPLGLWLTAFIVKCPFSGPRVASLDLWPLKCSSAAPLFLLPQTLRVHAVLRQKEVLKCHWHYNSLEEALALLLDTLGTLSVYWANDCVNSMYFDPIPSCAASGLQHSYFAIKSVKLTSFWGGKALSTGEKVLWPRIKLSPTLQFEASVTRCGLPGRWIGNCWMEEGATVTTLIKQKISVKTCCRQSLPLLLISL